jgi:hypothetical protein
MYYEAISQCVQMLKNIEAWLDKAEKHAATKKFDVNTQMRDRLAPDMQPLSTRSRALAITSRPQPLGFRDRYHPSTRTTSRRSMMCVPASARPLPSRRA